MKADPKIYRKFFITDSKRRMILYVKMKKDLYGILKSVPLFYLKLVGDLTRAGFKINSYEPCVMEKIVGGEHMTVLFHMDDLKVSHKIDKAITEVIEYLDGAYPELKAVRVDVHDYLGMRLEYSTKGQVEVSMMPYMKNYWTDSQKKSPQLLPRQQLRIYSRF